MRAAPSIPASSEDPPVRRATAWWPLWSAQLAVTAFFLGPLILGSGSLFFRDVGNFHWPAKLEQSRAWNSGETPHIDTWRAGGQPGIGNPNTTPLYPSNLLLRGGPARALWGFNAHFWLHLLLAPFVVAGWLRASGLRGAAPWVGAAAFGSSGFVIATLGFHNLVPYVVWIPGLLWSVSASVRARSAVHAAGGAASVALCWAMLLLAGDPTSALLALGAAAVSIVCLGRVHWARVGWPMLALAPGTLIAWPQVAALFGTIEGSMRGALGYSADGVLRGSWHPALVFDALFPFALGFPDAGFWGARFHGGAQPLFFTFFPGAAVIVLGAAGAMSAVHGRRRLLGLGLVIAGGSIALGGFNPIIGWLARSGALDWLRFPIKAWWWVALGAALLAALAVDGTRGSEAFRQRLQRWSLIAAGIWLASGVLAISLALGPTAWMERWVDHPFSALVVDSGLRRLAISSTASGVALLALAWTLRRPTVWRWAAWIAVFLAVQLSSLRPLFPMLTTEEVVQPVAAIASLPEGARLVHASLDLAWPGPSLPRSERLESAAEQQRGLNRIGVPMVGVASGGEYLFNTSPDGLDSYLPGAVRRLLRQVPPEEQLRLLPLLGATHLLAPRADGTLELVAFGRIPGPTFSSRWVRSTGLGDTLARLAAESAVDAESAPGELIVVADALDDALAGLGPVAAPQRRAGAPLTRVLETGRNGSAIEVNADAAGWLMLDRAWLPRYRATVDGVPVQTTIANALRLAVPVPAGRHRVEVRYDTLSWDDRWRFVGAGFVLLALVAWLRFRRGSGSSS